MYCFLFYTRVCSKKFENEMFCMENNCGNSGNNCGNQIFVGLTFELSLEAGNVLKVGKVFVIC